MIANILNSYCYRGLTKLVKNKEGEQNLLPFLNYISAN